MSSENPTPLPFDAALVAAALAGTWRYPAEEEPDGFGYMHFSGDSRVHQFVYDPEHPDGHFPRRLMFIVESPSTIRLCPKASPEGWTCSYQLEGASLTLLPPGHRFLCVRVGSEEAAAWFHGALAASLAHP